MPVPTIFSLRDYHPLWCLVPENFKSNGLGPDGSLNTTSLTAHHCQIQFALCWFQSLLLTASLVWFLFLQVLRRFNSLRLLSFRIYCEVTFGDSWFKGYMRLAKTFRSLSRAVRLPPFEYRHSEFD